MSIIAFSNSLKWLKTQNEGVFHVLFSGGVDSLAISHFLARRNKVVLHHFNHGLSGDDLIEVGCRLFAKELRLEVKVGKPVGKFQKGESIESWCRKQRYEYLAALNKTFVVCHHLDDANESYLVNCFEGHPEYCPLKIKNCWANSCFVRPFLLTPKKSLVEYCTKNSLTQYICYDPFTVQSRRSEIRKAMAILAKSGVNPSKTVKRLLEIKAAKLFGDKS